MRSTLPKVLHPLGGKPMVEHVVATAQRLHANKIIVIYGNGGDLVPKHLAHLDVTCVEQQQRLGTGHAVAQALPYLPVDDEVLILYGDVPLIQQDSLLKLTGGEVNVLTAEFADPTGLGRIVRDDQGHILAIVEHKDATEQQRAITEINSGILSTSAARLAKWLPQLSNDNAQQEYYLTDIIAMAVADGLTVSAIKGDASDVQGINDRKELAKMERRLQQKQAELLMSKGVTLLDPSRFDLRGTVTAGRDIVIDVNVILEGDVALADNVTIGPNCVLKNVQVASGTTILANSVIEDAIIGEDCKVGPFARVRPGTELRSGSRVGNFVEIKNSTLGEGSKIDHLSYIGDATIGQKVGIGAGTITCNYDGINKHPTVIEDFAFIGSDTQLVAPVRVGSKAVIGAGSTITKDAPSGELTLSRSKQVTVEGWKRPEKQS